MGSQTNTQREAKRGGSSHAEARSETIEVKHSGVTFRKNTPGAFLVQGLLSLPVPSPHNYSAKYYYDVYLTDQEAEITQLTQEHPVSAQWHMQDSTPEDLSGNSTHSTNCIT